jgi:mRNA-degrading endonuclease toxin of MazEF toxin-antitoxin module
MLVVPNWAPVHMFVLGMIGEYLGRLYRESKRRPLYIVSDMPATRTAGACRAISLTSQARPRRARHARRQRQLPTRVALQPETARTGC